MKRHLLLLFLPYSHGYTLLSNMRYCCGFELCSNFSWKRCCSQKSTNVEVDEPGEVNDNMANSNCEATEIFPFLFLGGLGNRTTEFLSGKHITSIVNASNMDPKKIEGCSQPYNIKELVIPVGDAGECDLSIFFESVGQLIDEAEKGNGRILVHCAAGISRSTTLVLAYLMKYKNIELEKAHEFVKSKRRKVKPNPGFWSQLIKYEFSLFGKNTIHMVETEEAVSDESANEQTALIPDIYKSEKTSRKLELERYAERKYTNNMESSKRV